MANHKKHKQRNWQWEHEASTGNMQPVPSACDKGPRLEILTRKFAYFAH